MDNFTTEIEVSTSFSFGISTDPGQAVVDIFSVQTFKYYALVMSTFFLPLISVFGIVANILNLVVFFSFPNKSSLVYAFMALSCWDLMFLLVTFTQLLTYILGLFQADFLWMFNSLAIFYYLETVRAWFYDLSILTTLFISVQRCACVLIPLQYKYYFSDFKMALVSSFCVICFSALHLARCTSAFVYVGKNSQTNGSVLIFVSADRVVVQIVHLVSGVTLPVTSYVVIFGCMWILILKLRASTAWRNKMASGSSASTTCKASEDKTQNSTEGSHYLTDSARHSTKGPGHTDSSRQQKEGSHHLMDSARHSTKGPGHTDSSRQQKEGSHYLTDSARHSTKGPGHTDSSRQQKEGSHHLTDSVRHSTKSSRRTDSSRQQSGTKWNLRAEQAVICVCAIFAVCNTLEVLKSILQSMYPTFGDPGYYYYAFLILTSSMIILNAINSTVNIFVYLKFNSQFRDTLRRMLFKKKSSKVPSSTLSF